MQYKKYNNNETTIMITTTNKEMKETTMNNKEDKLNEIITIITETKEEWGNKITMIDNKEDRWTWK